MNLQVMTLQSLPEREVGQRIVFICRGCCWMLLWNYEKGNEILITRSVGIYTAQGNMLRNHVTLSPKLSTYP